MSGGEGFYSALEETMKTFILSLVAVIAFVLPPLSTAAEDPVAKGLAIAKEADRRDTGWGDQQADMQMILRNRRGQESRRAIRTRTLEVQGDGDKGLTIFDTPYDIKGTAFLSFTHAIRPDDQWLYLPALKRVKRIASSNKSGPFMGSEFAYEDLTSQEVAKYTYKWLRDKKLDGRDAFVIERYPAYKYSGYTRQVVWVDKIIYQPLKIVYYDRKNVALKTLTFHDYKQYLNKYWRADRMEMVNHQTGKSTTLVWKNYRLKTGLTSRNFNRNSLKRVR
ncbi:MAG: outer membrane lipoprotein-sorting protein [Gammaproteobacteria bacterium]|nr:MAG: outer membrane lipoprotein-sorting protein [Gammaproteobacteria bacterium]